MVREKKYFLSLSLEKESVKREMRIPTREIEIVVPKIAHGGHRGPFPLSERDFSFSLLFFGLHFFFSFPKKRAFLFRERRHKSTTRITLYLSPSLEHRQTLQTDINHAVSYHFRLSFSLVRSALLILERASARRLRFLVNSKKVAHFAFHMRTFPNAR